MSTVALYLPSHYAQTGAEPTAPRACCCDCGRELRAGTLGWLCWTCEARHEIAASEPLPEDRYHPAAPRNAYTDEVHS